MVEDDNNTDTPKTKKLKRKRPKLLDPNAPKRPANAFIMYAELQRAWIREEKRLIEKYKPDPQVLASLANTTKALGLKWRNLDEKFRTLYQEMFRDLVKQYDHDIKEYMTIHPNAPQMGSKDPVPKNWSDPDAPKRPANAFFMFCEVQEDSLKNSVFTEQDLVKVSLSLGERWMLLSDSERAGKCLRLMIVYENLYQSRLETFRKYVEKEKHVVIEDSMQVDEKQDDDEDELESVDELVNTNHTSPL
jgi:HMG (high mobility group) box